MRIIDSLPAANAAPMADANVRYAAIAIGIALVCSPLLAALAAGLAR